MHTLGDQALAQPFVPPREDDDRALYMRGLLALRNGDAEDAVSLLNQALRWQPTHRGMRRNLVRALLAAEQYDQVMHQTDVALAETPDDGELHFARATALNALGQHARACAAFGRAVALRPDHAASWLNMGNASADLDDLTTAEALCRTAIRLDPELPEARASLGYILTMQGRLPEAIEACETAIRQRPGFVQAHWNLAIAALLDGDLPRGFTEYEWRKRHARYRSDFPELPGRQWDGSDANGRTILVRAEQGFGDVIQCARYLPLIRDLGATPILVCASCLVPLIRSMTDIEAIAVSDPPPGYDAWVDQISLPRVFGTALDTIPAAGGYLFADPERTAVWRARLPPGRKVGIALAGNPNHRADRRRSIPTDLVAPLPDIPGLCFVNLQYGGSAPGLGLPDLTHWMTDFAETAALIDALDLVVTVDTSVAHLAGALGKPVWIMLPHVPDWRWLLGRSDSPWYRSARLMRQTTPNDWAGVLNRVMRDLRREPLGPDPDDG